MYVHAYIQTYTPIYILYIHSKICYITSVNRVYQSPASRLNFLHENRHVSCSSSQTHVHLILMLICSCSNHGGLAKLTSRFQKRVGGQSMCTPKHAGNIRDAFRRYRCWLQAGAKLAFS